MSKKIAFASTGMKRQWFVAFAAVAAFLISGCNTPPRQIHERLTLQVDTPSGLRSGSSVVEYGVGFQVGWLGGMAGHSLLDGVRGEALVVDLGERGKLFVVLFRDLSSRYSEGRGVLSMIAFPALERKADVYARGDSTLRISTYLDSLIALKPTGDVKFDALPLLVRFGDVNDPKTVERVDPSNLAASFGAGVKLARAFVEITDDPLTTGIELALPWLDRLPPGATFDGGTTLAVPIDAPVAGHLSVGDFKWGMSAN